MELGRLAVRSEHRLIEGGAISKSRGRFAPLKMIGRRDAKSARPEGVIAHKYALSRGRIGVGIAVCVGATGGKQGVRIQ